MIEFGERLKYVRKLRGMTQERLSEKSGVKQGVISKLERGDQSSTTMVTQLAVALYCSPHWLSTGEGEMEDDGIMEMPTNDETKPSDSAQVSRLTEAVIDLVNTNNALVKRINAIQASQQLMFEVLVKHYPELREVFLQELNPLLDNQDSLANPALVSMIQELKLTCDSVAKDALDVPKPQNPGGRPLPFSKDS